MQYPPGTDAASFRFIPGTLRDDAMQEAWVAYLEAKHLPYPPGCEDVLELFAQQEAVRGASNYAGRERRYQKKHPTIDPDWIARNIAAPEDREAEFRKRLIFSGRLVSQPDAH